MEIIIQDSLEETSRLAADHVARLIRNKPNAVLGLATGNTPLHLYKELIRLHREEGLDFSNVTSFNLDEYLGLAPEHPCSYRHYMNENFFKHINIRLENTHVPDGLCVGEAIPGHCADYEAAIQAAGGLDLQILGIGSDGHIGFNEPSSSLASRTRIKTLTENTRRDNAFSFGGNIEMVPLHVLTMGIGTIMEAKQILLLAFGEAKAAAIAAAAEGSITASNPASILQMHPCAQVFLDAQSASRLEREDYYRFIFLEKPDWQK